jgi:hypothetical protein
MQLQAEVCDVDAVDYVEVQFSATPAETVTKDILKKGKQPWIGKVCVVAADEDSPATYKYEYSPLFAATTEGFDACKSWKPEMTEAEKLLEESVWYVKDWFTTTVMRNKRWWETVGYPAYVQFWEEADAARIDGRFKSVSVPLFVDDDITETEETQKETQEPESAVPSWQGTDYDADDEDAENNEN